MTTTQVLLDEPRWHEILPSLRRAALVADYLNPGARVTDDGKSLHPHAAFLATLAQTTEPEAKP